MNAFIALMVSILCYISFECDSKRIGRTPEETVSVLLNSTSESIENMPSSSCMCGAFLSGQFTSKIKQPPKGNPVLMYGMDEEVACRDVKQCRKLCLKKSIEYLPLSSQIVCGFIDRDCYKEKVTLFVNVCNKGWENTKMTAGKEYCCKNGVDNSCSGR